MTGLWITQLNYLMQEVAVEAKLAKKSDGHYLDPTPKILFGLM